MGWSFGWSTKQSLIRYLTDAYMNDGPTVKDDGAIKHECITRCYRGNNFSGVLWSVWRTWETGTHAEVRYIRCDLLRYQGGDWGYKDMEESMHPYYYSCPLGYLDMAPVACEEWRESVRQYHAKRNRKLKKGGHYKLVPGCTIKGRTVATIEVLSLKPLKANMFTDDGLYVGFGRFKKKQVAEEVGAKA